MVTLAAARAAVCGVLDPELPVLTLEDLGVLRDVAIDGDRVVVTLTPTYSGCPAMEAMAADVVASLPGVEVEVRTVLSPAWSTDWISEEGLRKLEEYGVAPPARGPVSVALSVRCPQCGSPDTEELSRFGSTACKALWRCRACREPFDRMKRL